MRKFLIYWLPLLAYVTLIFTLSSFSRIPFQSSLSVPDKLAHFCEYLILAGLVTRALDYLRWPGSFWLTLLLSMLAVAVLGGLDEWYQSTVPNRTPDVLDWLADLGGGLTGATAYLLKKRIWPSRPEVAG